MTAETLYCRELKRGVMLHCELPCDMCTKCTKCTNCKLPYDTHLTSLSFVQTFFVPTSFTKIHHSESDTSWSSNQLIGKVSVPVNDHTVITIEPDLSTGFFFKLVLPLKVQSTKKLI